MTRCLFQFQRLIHMAFLKDKHVVGRIVDDTIDSHFAKIVWFFRHIVCWFLGVAGIAQRLLHELHQLLAAQLL